MIKLTGEEDGCCSCVMHGMREVFLATQEIGFTTDQGEV